MMESLIGDAPAAPPEEKPATETTISHLDQAAPAPSEPKGDTQAWIDSVSKTLYVDGKPNLEALPEKYWKDGTPDLASALKARAELEKAFSRGEHKAPAEYDIGFLKEAGVAEDDPLVGSFKSWAKEHGISQDAFKKLASSYVEMQMQQLQAMRVSVEEEKKKLGPNADKIVGEMVGWGQNLVKKGVWSADDFEEFKLMGGTARGLNALMKVREFYGDMRRIPVDTAAVSERPSRDELNAMVGDPRYQSDPLFRQKVEKLFADAYPE